MNSGKRDAARTCIQQVKIMISLTLVFILLSVFTMVYRTPISAHYFAVISLVGSVLFGYVTLGSIAGFQSIETYNVYRPATRLASVFQFFLCVIGIVLYLVFLPRVF